MRSYGVMPDGAAVDLYTLGIETGLKVQVITYGGTIVGIESADRNGARRNVVLALPSLAEYLAQDSYLGALVGRFANRIGGASFVLDGSEYHLSRNDGDNCLHGGRTGFNKAIWSVVDWTDSPEPHLTLRHSSPDGDQGFPGAVALEVTYVVTGGNTLRIGYQAEADRPTVVNFTNHSYFNLGGSANADILEHELMIAAERFTPVDNQLIPIGQSRDVAHTPFDFRKPYPIGARIRQRDEQLEVALGYDHNFVLGPSQKGELQFAARARDPRSGRVLEVHTTEPAVQFYSGNHLDGTLRGPTGQAYGRHAGFCLETQHFPNSPNQPTFPCTVLRPGERFTSTTEYRFGIE
ncbi:aldose epimerase family protein [Bradyrhizobium sp. LHD-71]|uniref:aldose epimerase family protein n=1 Tax=Bradyrhizobium sp. LHD-71 TaxID=3072141 RepID=UPI00280CD5B3|nr:aldose epimerase family protein [Bradyrhizobium sp. LHD-71]MDQ8728258.1 aldose epimerase family protein [Bradyrhizobium sp. LHD-71]